MRYFIISLTSIFLSGCLSTNHSINTHAVNIYEEKIKKISLDQITFNIPSELIIHPTADKNHLVISNDIERDGINKIDEYRIEVFNSINSSCTPTNSIPSALDVVQASGPLKNSRIVTQSNDTLTIIGEFPGYPCEVDQCNDEKYGMSAYKGRYILCSEHKDKTVLIEINQITDNPKLAEEIFSTFRWIK